MMALAVMPMRSPILRHGTATRVLESSLPIPRHCVAGSRDCHPRSEAWVASSGGSFINMKESEGDHVNLVDETARARHLELPYP